MANIDNEQEGLKWQIGVWDRMSPIYLREVDNRFTEIIDGVIRRAALRPGQQVLDLGAGTGSVAVKASSSVTPGGNVTAVDISPEMLGLARQRTAAMGLSNITFLESRAEEIPTHSSQFDAVLACLSLMYVIDRAAAAREIARVLRPGGRFVAAVWSGPGQADIVLFQQTAGSFAPKPPVSGVGPGALADPTEFLAQLERAGIRASVASETTGFVFDDFSSAWDVLAGVTTAQLSSDLQEQAKAAVRAKMWPKGDGPRRFSNLTQYIVGARSLS
jgi:SAM-dependent methyltransferase